MGVMIGIGGGYMISIYQGLHHLGAEQTNEVGLSIAALRKLEKNDTESASKLLRLVIADNYLQHVNMTNSWWMRTAYRNPKLINQVEMAADDLPNLKQTIQEQRAKRIREAEQPGPDQPATQPADKDTVKDQPSPPTPKNAPR